MKYFGWMRGPRHTSHLTPMALMASLRLALAASAIVLASAVALAGCGLGAGSAPKAIELVVTRDFGQHVLPRDASDAGAAASLRVRGKETVMSLLRRNYPVRTRYSGSFVQSIDGFAGGHEGGQTADWFYYVNGVEATSGAAEREVHPGDHIWWDRHDWTQSGDIPVVVGSFPEPFLHGLDGKRMPVRIECARVSGDACKTVAKRLRAFAIPAAIAAISDSGEPQTLRVMVGPWRNVKGDLAARHIEDGPHASGVYARFAKDGGTLTLLSQAGKPTGTLGGGAGLIAAIRHLKDAPVWVVTGTDDAGVDLAAHALDRRTLRNHFAVALAPTGPRALPTSSTALAARPALPSG